MVYLTIQIQKLIIGFPKVVDEGQLFNLECIVLPLYGSSLMDLQCGRWDRKFSLKTVCLIGIQMVTNLILPHL